ncbi:MAG: 5-hydroxyisourate hydrolase [Betaproteobacteria bacterium]|jgi:5-hydroxyisourate hydrolase|nr:5-hydroxyisourate hydrolase [Betaproteobacteria bacterium]
MGKLSTHVLDTSCGKPASGMDLALYRQLPDKSWQLLVQARTNHDGRVDRALLEGEALQAGRYCLRFEVGLYFEQLKKIANRSSLGSGEIDLLKAEADGAEKGSTAPVDESSDLQRDSARTPVLVFLDQIPIEFGIADPLQSYHVPLLVTPWSYATYRGS